MTRRGRHQGVQAIKQRMQDGHYLLTDHAIEEMDDEEILDFDVVAAVVSGTLARRLIDDPRGPRYVMRGSEADGRLLEVVCRLVGSRVRVLTVYRVE